MLNKKDFQKERTNSEKGEKGKNNRKVDRKKRRRTRIKGRNKERE